MNAGRVSGWWMVAAAAVPICFDFMLEPWRLPFFFVYCVLLAFPAFLIWAGATGRLKE